MQYEDFLLAVGDYYCNGTEIPPVALTPAEQADEEHDHGQGVNKRCGKGVGKVWGYLGAEHGLVCGSRSLAGYTCVQVTS